jgi:hypothetical protein
MPAHVPGRVRITFVKETTAFEIAALPCTLERMVTAPIHIADIGCWLKERVDARGPLL